jgi:hypothetical protein
VIQAPQLHFPEFHRMSLALERDVAGPQWSAIDFHRRIEPVDDTAADTR